MHLPRHPKPPTNPHQSGHPSSPNFPETVVTPHSQLPLGFSFYCIVETQFKDGKHQVQLLNLIARDEFPSLCPATLIIPFSSLRSYISSLLYLCSRSPHYLPLLFFYPRKTRKSPPHMHTEMGSVTQNGDPEGVLGQEFTSHVIESMGPNTSPRMREVMTAFIQHIHDFAREVQLTMDEWMLGVQMINWAGQMSNDRRNEGQLMCDVIGLES